MLTGRKLLLADDSLTYQKVVSLILGDEGMEVVAVGSGAEALQQLERAAPDIVLADVFMPGPNGYELCAHVKGDARLRHVPVLLLVGTFEPFNEAEARRVGADDVLTKPFQSIRELVSKVGNLLGGRTDEPKAEESAPHTPDESERARPAEAHAHTAQEHEDAPPTFTWAGRQESPAQPHAFQDFDMDDQTIQTTPAAAYVGHTADATDTSAPFVVLDEEAHTEAHATDEAAPTEDAHTDEPEVAPAEVVSTEVTPMEAAPAPAHVSAPAPALSYAAAASAHAPEFVARTTPTDEALLDLGEFAQPAAHADADEFILDLGDEGAHGASAASPSAVEESRVLYAEGLASSPAEAAAPLLTEEAASTDARALEADAAAYMQPPQSGQAVEQVLPDDEAAEALRAATPAETGEAETWHEASAPESLTHAGHAQEPFARETTWAETDESAQPEAAAAHEAAAPVAASAQESSAADERHAPAAAESNTTLEPQAGAAQLSPETIDAIARRVVELMSDKVVREVVWEVVPELAERLIKRRIAEEQPQ